MLKKYLQTAAILLLKYFFDADSSMYHHFIMVVLFSVTFLKFSFLKIVEFAKYILQEIREDIAVASTRLAEHTRTRFAYFNGQ